MAHDSSRISSADLAVGQPLKCSLFDAKGKLLLSKGQLVQSERQLEKLVAEGVFRSEKDDNRQYRHVERPAEPEPKLASQGKAYAFEDTGVRVGDLLVLQDANGGQYRLPLVGYVRGQGLIMGPPSNQSGLVALPEGQVLSLRFFSRRHAYVFKAAVAKNTFVPFPLMFLDYPQPGHGQEIRKNTRVTVEVIAVAACGAISRPVVIEDISVTGARVRAKDAIAAVGADVTLNFKIQVAGAATLMTVPGVLRSSAKKDEKGEPRWYCGVEFAAVDRDQALKLSAYVHEQMALQV